MGEWMAVHSAYRLTLHLFELRDDNRMYSACGLFKTRHRSDVSIVNMPERFTRCVCVVQADSSERK